MTDKMYSFKKSLYDNFHYTEANDFATVLNSFVEQKELTWFHEEYFDLAFSMPWDEFEMHVNKLHAELNRYGCLRLTEVFHELGLPVPELVRVELFSTLHGFGYGEIGIVLIKPPKGRTYHFNIMELFK